MAESEPPEDERQESGESPGEQDAALGEQDACLLYTSPSPRDRS